MKAFDTTNDAKLIVEMMRTAGMIDLIVGFPLRMEEVVAVYNFVTEAVSTRLECFVDYFIRFQCCVIVSYYRNYITVLSCLMWLFLIGNGL